MSFTPATLLHLAGYPASFVILTRWLPVVRQRRWRWFATHQVAVTAVVTGWLLRGRPEAAVVNGAWLVLAAGWYALGGRGRAE